ncbi:RagB/SusD family nutrient uptake outer membrane protein [Arenibacter sp. F26102]|uniref:RagB/SusD family nutrient uptake outer membrane protein n=1 Tax=Arenibacter sp. F26102 TaxID=2926416 RepID=UPI001FF34323|nr:RagB/SusD family nutrient uptake outer membrane protein [Arenibacter sp. F26102]MCK0146481.1 RagB/SusD family nutrient uptake outer membrane protein [Arenibacter sp. F26102]
MKKYILSIHIILVGLLTSCVKLDTEPTDMASSLTYFSNETEVEYALNGIYDKIGSNYIFGGGDCLSTMFDVTDQAWRSTSVSITSYDYPASDVRVSIIWRELYIGIERANILLKNIDDADMEQDAKNVVIGEAKFLRAFYYFMLVQNYGAVPLKTEPTQSANDVYFERTNASEVYDFIYAEMVEAESLVNPITDYSYAERVTKSAVQGILARVSLYRAGFLNRKDKSAEQIQEYYENALFWAEKVINSGLHDLNPDYAQVFINLIQDQYETQESIFEIGHFTDGASGVFGTAEIGDLGNNNGIAQRILEYGYSGAQYRITAKLYNAFEYNDQYQDTRRDWCIASYRFVRDSNPPVKEYWSEVYVGTSEDPNRVVNRNIGKFRREYELQEDKIKNYNSTNNPLLRFSDVLLMAAEAENELNGPTPKAHEYLNRVRNRAQVSEIENISSKEAFLDILQDERYTELCFEGFRRMDLIRWGILVEEMREMVDYNNANNLAYSVYNRSGLNISEKDYYLPIPVRELSLDPLLTQNPGW